MSADVLQYELTVKDPKTWTQPWKVSFPLKRDSEYQIFEYACHEGNNSMRNILSGIARRREGREVAGVLASPAGSSCGRREAGRWPRRRSRPERPRFAPASPPRRAADAAPPPPDRPPTSRAVLARYMVAARDRELPQQVVLDAKARILDTVAAIVSGSRLPPGQAAIRYVRSMGGTPEASLLATAVRTTAVNAALANGMCAHADETDDFEPVTKAHPGCAVVPAALAMGERERRTGTDLVRAVTLGYDLCCRFLLALGPDHVRATHRSAEGTSATFGAVGAAAALARLDERNTRFALSYAAQQVSGLWSWTRDEDHIEKAFDFAGMGARNGVTAVTMVQAGLTGVAEVLDGEHNMLIALSTQPRPEEMVAGLGHAVLRVRDRHQGVLGRLSDPVAARCAADAAREHGLTPDAVTRLVVRLPPDAVGIVSGNAMPDVNLQHLMAVALIDGTVSFEMSHSRERMADPQCWP
jgi:2-methylcitrate dehydratase PrpD